MGRRALNNPGAAAACFIAVVLFVTTVTGGVCLCRKTGSPGGGRCLVSMDLCRAGSVSTAVQGMDTLSVVVLPDGLYFPSISLIPPAPDAAVASAEPGELDKPPEA